MRREAGHVRIDTGYLLAVWFLNNRPGLVVHKLSSLLRPQLVVRIRLLDPSFLPDFLPFLLDHLLFPCPLSYALPISKSCRMYCPVFILPSQCSASTVIRYLPVDFHHPSNNPKSFTSNLSTIHSRHSLPKAISFSPASPSNSFNGTLILTHRSVPTFSILTSS